MNDIESLRSELRDLRHRVEVLEARNGVHLATTTPVAPAKQSTVSTSHPRTEAKYGVLRVISGFIGAIWLLGGLSGLEPGLIIAGVVLLALAFIWPWKQTVAGTSTTTNTTSSAPVATATTSAVPSPRQPSALEKEFGTHWLSWLGMISLVVGVSFLLQYVFRSIGPWGNIATGMIVGVMLFFLHAITKKSTPAFAFLLQSGGWATIFISALAIRMAPGGSLLPAPITTLAILATVASMITAAVFQHSRTLTAGGFLLGYIGLINAPLDTATFASFALLAVGLAVVATTQKWASLVTIGTLVAYMVTLGWMSYVQDGLSKQLGISMLLVIAQALAFGAAHWTVQTGKKTEEQYNVVGTVVNLSGLFIALNYLFMLTNTTSAWEVAAMLTLVCGLLAGVSRFVQSRRTLELPYTLFASTFLAYASFQAFHGATFALVVLLETAILATSGVLAKSRGLQWSGYGFSVLSFGITLTHINGELFTTPYLTSNFAISLLGILVGLWIAFIERVRGTRKYVSAIFGDSAIGLFLLLASASWTAAWTTSIWMMIAVVAVVYGCIRKSQNARILGASITFFSALYWLSAAAPSVALAGATPITARLLSGILVVALTGAIAAIARYGTTLPNEERLVPIALWWESVVFLAVVLAVEVVGTWLSIAWGVTGITLLAIGLTAGIRTARRQGLSLVLLTIAKLYVIDIWTLNLAARIISFIFLGILILGISYWYNRLRTTHDHPTTTAS